MKKIPYAMALLAAYIIMTYESILNAFSGSGTGAAATIAAVILALGPVALLVLMAVNMKKNVAQIAAILCLVVGVANIFMACTNAAFMLETYRSLEDGTDYLLLQSPLHLVIGQALCGFLFWFVGAHIQDGNTTGSYKLLAGLGFLLMLFFGFMRTSTGLPPTYMLPYLLMVFVFWHLPHAFVSYETTKKLRVKHIISLVIVLGLYFGGHTMIAQMTQGY